MTKEEIEKYIDNYIDMGNFRHPTLARPYLIDGFQLGLMEASKLPLNNEYAKCTDEICERLKITNESIKNLVDICIKKHFA